MCDPGSLPGLFYALAASRSVLVLEVMNKYLTPEPSTKGGFCSRIQAFAPQQFRIFSLIYHEALDKQANVRYKNIT